MADLGFICPDCGDCGLFLVRKETTATELSMQGDGCEFDYGKEHVVDCNMSRLECGNDHILKFKDGSEVEDFEGFLKWKEEQQSEKK